MGMYYISACHDCKMHIPYVSKWTEETAKHIHSEFTKDHKGHNTELGNDYNDEFYDKVWKYERINEDEYNNR